MTRLENVYREKVVPVLQKEFAYSSPMQIPGIVKISLNIGLGSASQNNKLMEEAMNEVKMVVEGVYSAKAAYKLSQKYGVEMPIVSVVNRLLFEDLNAEEGMKMLLTRNRTSESTRLAWDNEQA